MKTLKENLLRNVGVGKIKLIETWLHENTAIVGRYTINENFEIESNIYLGIMITNKEITEIPDYIHFPKKVGYFDLEDCEKLTSLKNCPEVIDDYFGCAGCVRLTSLKGAPKEVGGFFSCAGCDRLENLEGAPESVGTMFNCSMCTKLRSLKGAPQSVPDNFSCSNCPSLTSLRYCPKTVGGDFACHCCGGKFSKEDVKRVCRVDGIIIA